ncbi:MAG TPA: C39 family peptidase [Candidatus Limnocylindria bacterium]|nr:C39 family peptidase [Candidatus Limnocylindria bacterium]
MRGRTATALLLAASVLAGACSTAEGHVPTIVAVDAAAALERAESAARVAQYSAIAARAGSASATMSEPRVDVKAALPAAYFGEMGHVWQSLNNCGPAAVVMALTTLGVDESQEVARLALRGTDERRGMGPQGVDAWVKERFGLRSMWRNNGTNELLKKLVSNGFAPMVTQWMEDPSISRVSHWRTVRGYDDAKGTFYVNDSMLGRGVALDYEWFGRNWQPFSYRYMVIYRPEDEARLRAIVGDDWNDAKMRRNFYERTRAEAQAQNTMNAWLAYGEASYGYGLFAEAVAAFEKGLSLGSPTGVFTLRSSYPNALRALGRTEEADRVARTLGQTLTPNVVAAATPPVDERVLGQAAERRVEAWYAALPEDEKPFR